MHHCSITRALLMAALLCCVPSLASAQTPGPTTDDFFNPNVLQEIRLSINSKDWEQLKTNYTTNEYYPCDLRWGTMTVRNVGIRSRGTGSRSGIKPGLRVDFNRYTSNQTFLGLKSFVLDNLSQDPSMLKERLSMLVFQRMGQPAPRETHAKLYVNNQYVGLYTSVESVDKDFLERTLGQNDGYLFEYRWKDTILWTFTYLGPVLESYQPMFEPKTHEKESISQIYSPIEAMVRDINQASDPLFETTAANYVDLDQVMIHVAIENVMAGNDGFVGYAGMNNFYLYRYENSTRSRFIVWDQDNTFVSNDFPIGWNLDTNILTRRAMTIPRVQSTYWNAMLETAASISSPVDPLVAGGRPTTWLEAEIEKEYQQIRQAALTDPVKQYTNEEFEAAILALRAFAAQRPLFVKCEVTRLVNPAGAAAACAPPPAALTPDGLRVR